MKENRLNIKQLGIKNSLFQDLYYRVLKASWPSFFLITGTIYLLLNLGFALLYFYSPAQILNARPDSLWDAFIFSFQTSSTVGYGHLLPSSNAAHSLVILDTLVGIFYVAIVTGFAFSKLARPMAKILFSDKAIYTTFDGTPTIMFRLANNRDTHIVDATLKVAALLPYTSSEGHELRRFYSLELLSSNNPTFSLSWTAMHQINEQSPLYGHSIDELKEMNIVLFVSFTGIDDVLSQSIHANYRYRSEDLFVAKKFVDILSNDGGNNYSINYNNFHRVDKK